MSKAQALADVDDKVLYVGDDAVGGEAAAVCQLVDGELGDVNTVEIDLSDRAVRQDAVGRRHVAGRDGMEHRRHADDGGRFADLGAHGVLRFIDIAVDRRERPVVPDRTGEYIGHMVFLTAVDDAVVNVLLLDELRDAAIVLHAVDGIEMVVVAERLALLRVDILAERRVEVGSLQVVCGQRIAGEHGVRIAACNNL